MSVVSIFRGTLILSVLLSAVSPMRAEDEKSPAKQAKSDKQAHP